MTTVELICIKVKSKLRIRITSPGYKPDANCSISRSIRKEGRRYTVSSRNVTLINRGSCYYYNVSTNGIIIHEKQLTEEEKRNIKVYETSDESECIICCDNKKNVVFGPCGHFMSCNDCAQTINNQKGKCPMCRGTISVIIDYDDLK